MAARRSSFNSSFNSKGSSRSTTKKAAERSWVFGAVCLTGYIVSWVAQAEICQYLQRNVDYNKPYFIVWINHSVCVFMLPIQAWYYQMATRPSDKDLPSSWFQAMREVHKVEVGPLVRTLCVLSALFALADWMWYVALGHTTVAIGSCVYNSQCVFAYLFSIPLLHETVRLPKVIGVALALGGVGLITAASASSDIPAPEQLKGNLCALTSAVLYALFEVLFAKYATQSDSAAVVNTATGILGAVSLLGLWFPLVIINYLPSSWCDADGACWFYEPFELPDSQEVLLLAVNAALALLFNYTFMLALVFTSPVVVATAGMVAIPVCAMADLVLHGDTFGLLNMAGFVLILAGFCMLVICGSYSETDVEQVQAENSDNSHDGLLNGDLLNAQEGATTARPQPRV